MRRVLPLFFSPIFVFAVFLAGFALASAWFSELVLGYIPCSLCLLQRIPYYIGLVWAGLTLVVMRFWGQGGAVFRFLLLGFGLIFLISAFLGIYHAGVEWKFWLGPSGCSGRLTQEVLSIENFNQALQHTRIVLCDEAAIRILGLSFAGWNTVCSFIISGLSFFVYKKQTPVIK